MILSVYEISSAEWMTSQRLYLTWYPMYLCNQIHLTNDITTYVRMKQHPLHAWHHRHFTWHHIHSCWQHTIVSMSWHKLCLWHHMLTNSALYLTWNTLNRHLIHYICHHTLYLKTSHLQCKISQVEYVCHDLGYTGHDIHTLWQPLQFMASQAL